MSDNHKKYLATNLKIDYIIDNNWIYDSIDNSSPLLGSVLSNEDKVTERKIPVLKEYNPELF